MATNKLRSFGALRYHHNKSGFRGVFYDAERRRWRAEVGSHEERVRGPSPARDYDQLARKRYGDLHPAPICVQVFVTSVTISRSTAISIRADASIVANATPGRRRAEKTASAPPTKAREAGTRECPHRDPDRRARRRRGDPRCGADPWLGRVLIN